MLIRGMCKSSHSGSKVGGTSHAHIKSVFSSYEFKDQCLAQSLSVKLPISVDQK